MLPSVGDDGETRVRLNFQLRTSENPLLVRTLLELPKGKVRHARLATLATIGLLAEARLAQGDTTMPLRSAEGIAPGRDDRRQLSDLSDALLRDIEEADRG